MFPEFFTVSSHLKWGKNYEVKKKICKIYNNKKMKTILLRPYCLNNVISLLKNDVK